MKRQGIKVIFILLVVTSVTSCFVQSPKYSTLDKVMSLQLGMSKAQVEDVLGVQPYNLKAYTDTSSIYVYIYRVTDRRTIALTTGPVNGKKSIGKYVQLFIAFSKQDEVINIESCSLCPDNLVTNSKIDFSKVLVFITVTLPVVLVYFGLK